MHSHVNLNKLGAHDKNIIYGTEMASILLIKSHYIQISTMQSTRHDGTKMPSTGFIAFLNHDTSNIPNISNPNVNLELASQTKFDKTYLTT